VLTGSVSPATADVMKKTTKMARNFKHDLYMEKKISV
jgi:hypothetical protein